MTQLPRRWVEKPWGRDILPPPFSDTTGKRIGEVWFDPPAALPSVLVKYIFTSEKLSVQVHPTDEQARALGEHELGKEECWLVIDAAPDAVLGVGFHEAIDTATMRQAARDGTIEQMLSWYPVQAGDFFYIPAGTVHAIGGGVSLLEIQQNSDLTYRLYDYGRPRELHIDKGFAVAKGEPYPSSLHRRLKDGETVQLLDGDHMTAHRVCGVPDHTILDQYSGPTLILPREGSVVVNGERLHPGDCGLAGSMGQVSFEQSQSCIVVGVPA
ncbi:MAG: hypothetical protein RIS85_1731 [Pseudomonadota bacterium]